MNRIVREHYPVSQLPEDLRQEFPGQDFVDIVVKSSGPDRPAPSETGVVRQPESKDAIAHLGGQFSRFKHLRSANYTSIEEVNDYVSSLRDEWAHRE